MTDWASCTKERNTLFENLYKARDFKSMCEQYTEDCVHMPPGSKLVCGRQAAEDSFSELSNSGVDHVTVTTQEAIPSNQTAVERGAMVMYKADGTVAGSTKFVVLWKMENGKPRMYTDIWNFDAAEKA